MSRVFSIVAVFVTLTLSGCGVEWFPETKTTTPPTTAVADFSFNPATVTGVTAGSTQTSNSVTITITGTTSAAISVTGGTYSIGAAAFTSSPGTISSGDSVRVQHAAGNGFGETVTTTLTIGNKTATFSSTTDSATVTAFQFTPASLTGVPTGSVQTSNTITVALTGGTTAPVSISGGEYQIGSAAYTSANGTVKNGDTITVHHTAASTVGTTVTTTLSIGDKIALFSSTTATAVNPFSFAPVTGVTQNTLVNSAPVTITLNTGTSAPISVQGGQYSLDNGTSFTSAAGTINSGQTVIVQHTSGTGQAASVTSTLIVGDQSASFTSTTSSATPQVTVDQFSFNSATNVVTGSTQTSNAITVSLTDGTAADISIVGGSYSINGGVFTSDPGAVQAGDSVRVQHVAASANNATTTTTLMIADKSATFTSTTSAYSVDDFPFQPAVVSALPGTDKTSNQVTVTVTSGTSAPISITGSGAEYNIGSGTYTSAAGTVNSGDTVTVHIPTPTTVGTMATATLTIGPKSFTFSSISSKVTVQGLVFNSIFGGSAGTDQTSNPVTLNLVGGTSAPISITGGKYSINSDPFTAASGTVNNGDTVALQVTRSATIGESTTATVTIGATTTTFTSSTSTAKALAQRLLNWLFVR